MTIEPNIIVKKEKERKKVKRKKVIENLIKFVDNTSPTVVQSDKNVILLVAPTISKAVHAYIPAVRTVGTSPGTVSTVKQAGFTSPAVGSIKPHRSRSFTVGCVVYSVANKLVSE